MGSRVLSVFCHFPLQLSWTPWPPLRGLRGHEGQDQEPVGSHLREQESNVRKVPPQNKMIIFNMLISIFRGSPHLASVYTKPQHVSCAIDTCVHENSMQKKEEEKREATRKVKIPSGF